MKHYLFLFLILSNFQPLIAQRNFAKYMIVGASLSYIREHVTPDNSNFDEYVWNLNTGISVSKKMFVGIQVLPIYTSYQGIQDKYNLYGLFSQYNFLRSKERRFFAELSLNKGDYCTCSEIPYQVNNLHYLGAGVGYDYPVKIVPNLFIDFSFMIYQIINKPGNYYFTQYIIGLNYKLK